MPAGAINIFESVEYFLAAAREELAKVARDVDGKAQRHAFVFVHGYRVTFENAAFRSAQIAFDLAPDGQPFASAFLYSWPSGGRAADYGYDLDSSRLAIPSLTRFLELVIDQTEATHVHVIAHSMGNFPLIQALGQLKGRTQRARINQIIFAAPDVDKAEFERIAGAIADFGAGATLYASASDRALLLSRLGRRNTPRAGDVKQPPGPALAAGIDTIDVSALSTGMFSWGWNHDTYSDSREIINDIALQFRNGPSRPDSRNVNFRPQSVGGRMFWRYRD
jgi:esterase/lipase superfamily enzyme